MKNILYKYRNLNDNNWFYFLDIILNQRLYCSKYKNLNDPMEGRFFNLGENNNERALELYLEKQQYKICSLTNNNNEPLMWAHYSDGNKGICIGVKVIKQDLLFPINYSRLEVRNLFETDVIDVLTHKNPEWQYEEEIRVLNYRENYVKVEIKEIIFGCRIDQKCKNAIIQLINKLKLKISLYQQDKKRTLNQI